MEKLIKKWLDQPLLRIGAVLIAKFGLILRNLEASLQRKFG